MKPEQRQQAQAKAGSTCRRGKHTKSGSHVVNKCGSGAAPPLPSIHTASATRIQNYEKPTLMRSEKRRRLGGRQNQTGRGVQEMSTEEGGEEGRRRKGEFCGFATGPLIKMHKLSKCGEFDELSSLATLDAKCGQSMGSGRGGWILLCMQSIFNYVA